MEKLNIDYECERSKNFADILFNDSLENKFDCMKWFNGVISHEILEFTIEKIDDKVES